MTPQECADALRELGNMSPSKSTLDRLPKHLSSRWEEHREAFEASLRADAPDRAGRGEVAGGVAWTG